MTSVQSQTEEGFVEVNKVYLAGPMSGIAEFNFPAFHAGAKKLREQGYIVFNPAEADEERHGKEFASSFSKKGDVKEAEANGFSLRDALAADTHFICKEANAIAMLPGWEASGGARAEWALAHALRLKFIYLD